MPTEIRAQVPSRWIAGQSASAQARARVQRSTRKSMRPMRFASRLSSSVMPGLWFSYVRVCSNHPCARRALTRCLVNVVVRAQLGLKPLQGVDDWKNKR